MKIKKGLLKKEKNFIQKSEWYHQRFDACPQFAYIIAEAELRKEKRKFTWGDNRTHWGCFFNDRLDWYIDMKDIKRITNGFIKLAKKERNISKKLIKKWDKDEKDFYKYCYRVRKMDLKKISNKRLGEVYNNMLERSIRAVTSSSLIDGFALGSDNYIFEQLQGFLNKNGLERQLQRYFAVLTAPVHQSFITDTEVRLLRIGRLIKKSKSLSSFIKKSSVKDIERKIKEYHQIYKKLINYQKLYFWTRNNYVDNNILSVKFFIKELAQMVREGLDFDKEINRLVETPKKNSREKEKLMRKLSLPFHLKNLLIISEDFTWWQDERKKKTYWYNHHLSLILKEIAGRYNYTFQEIKYFLYPEIINLFESNGGNVPTKKDIARRIKYCTWFKRGDNFEQVSGEKAVKLRKEFLKKDTKDTVNDFRGMAASKGRVKGRVKILKSVKDSNKIKKGDILVAVMTRPDYVPAMRKAKAIITNEGGVTCHAAIVSRELGIPCVIGTKIATEVLKDGYEVEVNANHGVITILKR